MENETNIGKTTRQKVAELRNVEKHFGDQAVLNSVNLDLYERENLVILGKSGSGKSVLIKCMVGLLTPDRGEIKVLGYDVPHLSQEKLNEYRLQIGFSFQGSALYDSMTIRENLEFPLKRNLGIFDKATLDDRVMLSLREVGLEKAVDKKPAELSGGMKKRIGIARTLILKPKIMLYDEPTAGLDPITSAEINELILEMRDKHNTASIIITHDISSARATADRVIALFGGINKMEGTFDELKAKGDAELAAFLTTNNFIMSQQEYKQNIKLGAFVLGGIVIFLSTIFYLGSQNNFFNKTYMVSAIFKNVEGLKEGDNVWLSGVKVGTIKKVQIISEGKVIVQLSLKDKQNEFIKKDATAFIGSDGLIGNKIVVIRPGSSVKIIENGDTINSYSPTDTQELFNIAKEVGTNTQSITDDLKLISSRLSKGEGIFGELLHDGPISDDLRFAILSLKLAGDNTNKATAELNLTMHKINNGEGLVTKLLTDTSYVATFESALNNIAQVGADTKRMSHDLQAVIAKINNNNNAVGVLLADTVFANKLKSTLDNAQSASVKLDENMEAMQHNFLLKGYFKKQKKAEKKQ